MISIAVILCLGLVVQGLPEYHHCSRNSRDDEVVASNGAESTAEYWYTEAQNALQNRLATYRDMGVANNAIMFLGDGMSIPTVTAARIYQGQLAGQTGEEQKLSFEKFPTVGLAKTYCVNAQIPDSACTATAYLGGVKTNTGTAGVTSAVSRGNCTAASDASNHVHSIAEWALQSGRDVGIVTTTRVTHASPSGAYAHTAERNWESDADVKSACGDGAQDDIALQLIHSFPGNQFKVILGGGRREFRSADSVDEEGDAGRRLDGRDLIAEWQEDKASRNLSHTYVWHRQQLLDLPRDTDYLLGLFESNHLQYHLEGPEESEPTLSELTAAAIRVLSKNPRGFFLFVEGGRIDHAHHETYPHLALDETVEMAKAVAEAQRVTSPSNTLIVVTSDHAHTMSINGYSGRGNDVLGASRDVDEYGVPYMTLSYANGPGYRAQVDGKRVDVTKEAEFRSSPRWRSHADVPLVEETHGGDDVAVFAVGPRHHLFSGVYEQSQIPYLMGHAGCFGPGLHACR